MDQAKIVGIIIRGIINICNELLAPGGDPAISAPAGMPGGPPAANPVAGNVPPPPGAGETVTGNVPDTKKVPPAPDDTEKETPKTGPKVKLDKEGLPWDARIHTAKKSVLKSGVWRLKPGCDPLLVAQVKSELTLATRAAADEIGADGPVEDESGADQESTDDTDGAEEFTWANLISLIVEKGCAPDAVLKACKDCGVDNIGKLQESPEQIPTVRVMLGI